MAVLKYKSGDTFVTLTNYTVQPVTPVQTTGNSLTDIMSQKAVTDELNKKVDNTDLNTKIVDAISGDAAVQSALNVQVADAITNNSNVKDAIADVLENSAEISGAINTVVAEAISSDSAVTEAVNDAVAEAISSASAVTEAVESVVDTKLVDYYKKDETSGNTELDTAFEGKADLEHTHEASAITDFNNAIINSISGNAAVSGAINTAVANAVNESDEVKNAISSAVENSPAIESAISESVSNAIAEEIGGDTGITIVESIETVVEKYIYGESTPSSSSTIVTTDNLETTLADYAKSSDIPTDLSAFTNSPNYVTSGQVDGMVAEAISESETVISAITEVITQDSGVTQAINAAVEDQLDAAVSGKADSSSVFADAEYDSNEKKINFKNAAGTVIDYIDATDFIKDGMVSGATISGDNLVIIFNTDAGADPISIPLTSIFNPNNYYDKTAIDGKLGSGFTSSSVTEVIESNERVISASLNDLNTKKLDASAYTPADLSQYWTSAQTSAAINSSVSGKADAATTLSGYGITDAKIEGTTITLGSNTITPLTAITSGNVVDALGYTPANETSLGTMASEDKNSYSSATEVNTALGEKADTTAVTASITEAVSGKLDITVFETYSGNVDTALTGKISAVTLTSGTNNGTLKLTVDGVVTDNIAVTGLGTAAFQNADDLIGSGDVITLIDDKLGSGFTGENSGKTVTDVIVENEEILSAAYNELKLSVDEVSGDVITEAVIVSELSGNVENLDSRMSYYSGHTTVTSLSGIPTTKRLVIATVSGSSNELSLSGNTLADGNEIHVIIKNGSSEAITITLPSSGGYTAVGGAITIASGSTGEVNIISDGTSLYVRGA